jgi:hypothetical protein
LTLILPIFFPSVADPQSFFPNVIDTATFAMYILSFPLSLFGIPLVYVSQIILGVDPGSIEGRYLNLFIVFLLGAFQWFWIIPRLLRKLPEGAVHEITVQPPLLSDSLHIPAIDFFDLHSRTPLERVLDEKDKDNS